MDSPWISTRKSIIVFSVLVTTCFLLSSVFASITFAGSVDQTSSGQVMNSSQSSSPLATASIHNISVGFAPKGLMVDPVNHLLYVANYGSENISVINLTTMKVVDSIYVGYEVWHLAFDPINNMIYVASDFSNKIFIIDPESNSLVGAISTMTFRYDYNYDTGVSYDPNNGMIYVAADETYDAIEIDPNNGSIMNVIPLGGNPASTSMVFVGNYLYVAIHGEGSGSTVQAYDANTAQLVSVITVGTAPNGMAFDSENGFIYVANEATDNISVINSSNNKIVSAIALNSTPNDIAYDASNGYVYVTGSQSGNVYAIKNLSVASVTKVGEDALDIICDSHTGQLAITDTTGNEVTEVSPSSFTTSVFVPPGVFSLGNPYVLVLISVAVVVTGVLAASLLNRRYRKQ